MSQDNSHIPIPEEFYNSETKQPFTECLMCNQSIKESQYVVEKAIRNYSSLKKSEVIFEYAMCLHCAAKMHMELSDESRSRIEAFMSDHLKKKSQNRDSDTASQIKKSLSQCIVKETELSNSTEYSIYALCNGAELTLSDFPYALSGEVQDEIMQLLSAKSLEILDDFIGNHFTGPPEVMEILKRRPVFI